MMKRAGRITKTSVFVAGCEPVRAVLLENQ